MTDEQRTKMTVSCRDTDLIPKVSDAGKVVHKNGLRTQIMHNGLQVLADGYCGEWMTHVIASLNGHHEPQEELIFFELLKHIHPDSKIIELGSNWAYYTCWFLKDVPGASALCVEPLPHHLELGKKNAEINGLIDKIEFKNAWVGRKIDGGTTLNKDTLELDCLTFDDLIALAKGKVELLHVDIQGGELELLKTVTNINKSLRFIVVSTHHKSISGSATTHRDCMQSILDLGGFIMVEHDIDESFSGDGLIVASFDPSDRKIELPPISRNLQENCLFPPGPFISYAQNFEDVMLWRALKHVKNGFYVDVGANDPVVDSVSKAFYDRGWRGVHIEPTPQYAHLLRQARVDETVLEVALTDFNGVIALNYMPDTGISTAIDANASYYVDKHGFDNQRINVPALTLKSALQFTEGKDIHWLKIDVEGLEEQVLKGWDSQSLRPWVIVIEATLPGTNRPAFVEWEHILVNANYQFVYFDGLNRFYVASEHGELIPALSVPPNVFDGAHFSGLANSAWCGLARSEADQSAVSAKLAKDLVNLATIREQALLADLAQAGAREKSLILQLERAAARETFLRKCFDPLSEIGRILAERKKNGTLRLRQLVRHPKSFIRESIGLKPLRKPHHAPHLKNGFVDEAGACGLSLRWIIRQPSKAAQLLLRHPRKTIRFVVRHPSKFFTAPLRARHTGTLEQVQPERELKGSENIDIGLSPEAQAIYLQLKRSIERNRKNAHRY